MYTLYVFIYSCVEINKIFILIQIISTWLNLRFVTSVVVSEWNQMELYTIIKKVRRAVSAMCRFQVSDNGNADENRSQIRVVGDGG